MIVQEYLLIFTLIVTADIVYRFYRPHKSSDDNEKLSILVFLIPLTLIYLTISSISFIQNVGRETYFALFVVLCSIFLWTYVLYIYNTDNAGRRPIPEADVKVINNDFRKTYFISFLLSIIIYIFAWYYLVNYSELTIPSNIQLYSALLYLVVFIVYNTPYIHMCICMMKKKTKAELRE